MSEEHGSRDHPERAGPGLRVARAAIRLRGDLPLALLDCFMVTTSYALLLVLRFELSVPSDYWGHFLAFLAVALVAHVAANRVWGAYGHMWRHASFEEARRLLFAGGSVAAVLAGLLAWPDGPLSWEGRHMPLSIVLVGPFVATTAMAAVRFQSRLFAFRRGKERDAGLRVVVVGAGSGGAAVLREMRRDEKLGLSPVAVVDDDPRTWGRSLSGVRVVGGLDELERLVRSGDVHQVMLAIPSAGPDVARRVAQAAGVAEVPVKIIPPLAELVTDVPLVKEARELRIDDLLGRAEVEVDFVGIAALLRNRRVLVTGGGGSIGAEIARQVADFEPSALALLDLDETHLHDAALDLPVSPPVEQLLVDVRDRDAMMAAFAKFRPEIVFHAAARKHVPLLETHACEAVATNVLGTGNVVDAAYRFGVERLVSISTDKAAAPVSVMGASKWVAEQVVLERTPPDRAYCSVRFGNVLGSRGSVIPTFQRQIEAGGPVTVTDPRMTRYFMSSREAVSLVLQAAAVASDHELFMLEMGEPVNILELAERMIRLSGYEVGTEIPVQVTGLRPGERLSERLQGPGETVGPTAHVGIVELRPARLEPGELDAVLGALAAASRRGDEARCRHLLEDIVGRAHRADARTGLAPLAEVHGAQGSTAR